MAPRPLEPNQAASTRQTRVERAGSRSGEQRTVKRPASGLSGLDAEPPAPLGDNLPWPYVSMRHRCWWVRDIAYGVALGTVVYVSGSLLWIVGRYLGWWSV